MARFVIWVTGLLALAGCSVMNFPLATSSSCTMEAKECPDGSYVTRTGPNCSFKACPGGGTPESPLPPAVQQALPQSLQR